MCRALGLFLTHKQCDAETGQVSSVETGQMSAVGTGQMSAAEAGQMSAAETGQTSAVETRQMSTIATGQRLRRSLEASTVLLAGSRRWGQFGHRGGGDSPPLRKAVFEVPGEDSRRGGGDRPQ